MKCPECNQGDLRVIVDESHKKHQLICDDCFTVFYVPRDRSHKGIALPPEFSIKVDYNESNFWQVLFEKRPDLISNIKKLSLLEDFKAALAKK